MTMFPKRRYLQIGTGFSPNFSNKLEPHDQRPIKVAPLTNGESSVSFLEYIIYPIA